MRGLYITLQTSLLTPVGFGTQLFENDRVRTSGSASVSIYYSNGDLLVIGANRTVTISDSSNPTTEGAVPDLGVYLQDKST